MSNSVDVEGPLTTSNPLAWQRSTQRQERRFSLLCLTALWVQLSPDVWNHGLERLWLLYFKLSVDSGDKWQCRSCDRDPLLTTGCNSHSIHRTTSYSYRCIPPTGRVNEASTHQLSYMVGLRNSLDWWGFFVFFFTPFSIWGLDLTCQLMNVQRLPFWCGGIKDVTTEKIIICS